MKVKVKANEITDADITKVSLVKRGANRSPFKIVKAEEAGMFAKHMETARAMLKKMFSPYISDGSFPENVRAGSFYPGMYQATEALMTTIYTQLDSAEGKPEAAAAIEKTLDEFKTHISKLVGGLPEKVFKEDLTNSSKGSTVTDNQVQTDGDTTMTKQKTLTEVAKGDLDGLNDPAQIAKDQAKMAADAARIEKEAADKVAADKVAADAEAVAKAAADKAEADKVAADAAAAEVAKNAMYKTKKVKKADGKTYDVQYHEVDGIEEIVKETAIEAAPATTEVAKTEVDIAAIVAKAVAEAIAPLAAQLTEVKKTAEKKVVIHKGLNDIDASLATRTPKGRVEKAEVSADAWKGSALDIFDGFRS